MKKKVSVILPVYNGEKYLVDAIESVIYQTYNNWELIIVNDCSTDNSINIAKYYSTKDSRIKVYSNNKNLKLPRTLNVGFSYATGEYFTWISADNLFKPLALEYLVKSLEENEDAAMVYADFDAIDSEGNFIRKMNRLSPQYIVTQNICGACFLYTAKVAKRIGDYDNKLFLAEDYDYWLRIYKNAKIIHLEKNLYKYRLHSESLTETKKRKIAEQTYTVMEKNFLFLYCDAKLNHLNNQMLEYMMNLDNTKHRIRRNMFIRMQPSFGVYLIFCKIRNMLRKMLSKK